MPTPTDDLVARLRAFECSDALGNGDFSVCYEAAATIERLQADVDMLGAFVIAVGGFWGHSRSKLVGEDSLAASINSDIKEVERLQAENEALRALLVDAKEQIEQDTEQIEGEWGNGCSLKQLIAADDMPGVWSAINATLKEPS